MPDNWSFVLAAYALAALILGGYARRLVRRDRVAQPRVHPRSAPGARTSRP